MTCVKSQNLDMESVYSNCIAIFGPVSFVYYIQYELGWIPFYLLTTSTYRNKHCTVTMKIYVFFSTYRTPETIEMKRQFLQ
jgi:hypothetical protein